MFTPKMSIFFLIPAMAPDTAKATVPMMSVIKMKSSVSIGDIIYVFTRKYSCSAVLYLTVNISKNKI